MISGFRTETDTISCAVSRRYSIPGIALSGFGMKQDVENSIAAGFSRHFTKPVDWQELKTEIQRD